MPLRGYLPQTPLQGYTCGIPATVRASCFMSCTKVKAQWLAAQVYREKVQCPDASGNLHRAPRPFPRSPRDTRAMIVCWFRFVNDFLERVFCSASRVYLQLWFSGARRLDIDTPHEVCFTCVIRGDTARKDENENLL